VKTSESSRLLALQVSQQVREAILRQGVTVSEAAEMLGISRSSLHHILKGSAIPSVETLARMVSLWNVNLQVTDGSIMTTMALTPRMYRDQRSDHSRVKIFLCHASEDKPKVRQLYVQLRDDGFSAWLDTEDLIPGQDWSQAIRAEVKKSDVVVVCLSKNAVQKSGFIQREISLALDAAEEKPEGTILLFQLYLRIALCQLVSKNGNGSILANPRDMKSFLWLCGRGQNSLDTRLHL